MGFGSSLSLFCVFGGRAVRNFLGWLMWVHAGQIGYALAPLIARGLALGPDQPVILQLLDIPPAAESLNGVKMELIDAAYPLLKGTIHHPHSSVYVFEIDQLP